MPAPDGNVVIEHHTLCPNFDIGSVQVQLTVRKKSNFYEDEGSKPIPRAAGTAPNGLFWGYFLNRIESLKANHPIRKEPRNFLNMIKIFAIKAQEKHYFPNLHVLFYNDFSGISSEKFGFAEVTF